MHCRIHIAVLVLSLVTATAAFAQDGSISGTVLDESKGVLPGVTMTATNLATGRQYMAVSTDQGSYRFSGVAAGRYRIVAELAGFATVTVSEVELLVGQNATFPINMQLATVTENVTVSGAAPLVDVVQARVAGNVDRRQMEQLPISGRNWQQLSMMVKGVTANTVTNQPGVQRDASFQLNLDGQQITQNMCCSGGFGQPGISRDAISEFQVITNLFDVTMGRSVGIQVQAVTRSGTNNWDGSMYGFFRDDTFNAKDAFANRVLPYSNSQVGGTFGGPVLRDKLHFFSSYEYENEPTTSVLEPPALPGQRFELPGEKNVHNALGRVDYQAGDKDRFTVRSSYWRQLLPVNVTGHPSRANSRLTDSKFTTASWTRVSSNTVLHELKANYFHYHWLFQPSEFVPAVAEYIFPGLTLDDEGVARPEDRRRVPAWRRQGVVAGALARADAVQRAAG
jgi:hypothetical protein